MSQRTYADFLKTKIKRVDAVGFTPEDLNSQLFDFQTEITEWAIRRGRAAIFADCGLGKTPIQLEWAEKVCEKENGNILIVAPLAVNHQTVKEGVKFGIEVNPVRHPSEIKPGINITNYEMVHRFDPEDFIGIVLDESSILKSYSGKYRQDLTDFARGIPYRLCCTATPAPNDLVEIINHSEFLGVMNGKEVIALFFKQDGNTTHAWKLKGHAVKDFWRWMATWSVAIRKPSDLGYSDEGFVLPELRIHEHVIQQTEAADGYLFPMEGLTLNEQRRNRKVTMDDRVAKAVEIIAADPDEQWLIWCNLNEESAKGKIAFEATEVKGADKNEHKEASLLGFSDGTVQRLITKPSIAGFGMNWQSCHSVIFLGLSHSYEQFYQAVRRVWRFGQTKPVDVHMVMSNTDGPILRNIKRKEGQVSQMMDEIIGQMRDIQLDRVARDDMKYETEKVGGVHYDMWLGDSIKLADDIEPESVGLSVFSPPFPGMYVYTNSDQDIGNCKSIDELIEHFGFLMPKILAATMPGRSCCVHLTQGITYKWQEGYVGIKDFRGKVITAMEDAGWIYYGEVAIDKNPQVKAIRTKDQGLLFKTLAKDSANMHMALADYLLQFRKHGDNPSPIRSGISERYDNKGGWITSEEWIKWARPIWYGHDIDPDNGIKETDVLNVRCAREEKDERHLCPLQLGVIERAVKLWSNPGDLVFSPFAGIGSEGYMALNLERRFLGIELKRSYFETAVNNLKSAGQPTLFEEMGRVRTK